MRLSEKIIRDVGALREQGPTLDLTSRAAVIHNLIWIHQIIVASERLMEVAHDAAPYAARVFRGYMENHVKEERNHAEWLASDLATIGIDVAKLPLNRSAVELAGSQYYFILHKSPAALLGYMAVLEGFPVPVSVVEQLEQLHGKDLFKCLRYHAENDPEHRKELFRVIDELDDPVIYENAIRTQFLMNEAMRAYPQ